MSGEPTAEPTPPPTPQKPDGWQRFAFQAFVVSVANTVAVTVAVAAMLASLGDSDPFFLVGFVLFFGFILGLVPSVLAAATMRSWRLARPTSPYAIAALFAAAMLAVWGARVLLVSLLDRTVGPGAGPTLTWAGHFAVGALFAVAAGLVAGAGEPIGFGFFGALLASMMGSVLRTLFFEDSGAAASYLLPAAALGLASFAGAWAYAVSEPKLGRRPAPAMLQEDMFP